MNKYEGIIIFKGDLNEEQLEKEYAKTEELVKKQEAKIEKSEKWGKKKLTFEIDKFRDGFFLYVAFEALPGSIKTLTDTFKLDNNILRAQIIRLEK